jgi:hypothetical protein
MADHAEPARKPAETGPVHAGANPAAAHEVGPHDALLNRRPEGASIRSHARALNGRPAVAAQRKAAAALARPNRTGLPDRLKSGVEALSGLAMDDVRVHRNSAAPAELGALAYAQGTDIHLGPGQEEHLPHEAWHVVQQRQGRVRATRQMAGPPINAQRDLEAEADRMGARAADLPATSRNAPAARSAEVRAESRGASGESVVQRKVGFEIEVQGDVQRSGDDAVVGLDSEESEEEQYFSLAAPLLTTKPIRPARRKSGRAPITKGDTMHAGAGWTLTPDGGEGNWYPEFITQAVDETKRPLQLATIVRDLVRYAQAWKPRKMYELDKGYRLRIAFPVRGSFQVTGGIRIDRLVDLLEEMAGLSERLVKDSDRGKNPKDRDSGSESDEDRPELKEEIVDSYEGSYAQLENQALRTATGKARAAGRSAKYQGLVALLGSYVAGQRVRGEEGGAPSSAKHLLPLMSRTNLGVVRAAVGDMPTFDIFVRDVAKAGRLPSTAGKEKLFPFGLSGGASAARTIDAQPDITVRTWLQGIFGGRDLEWSETRASGGAEFGMEKVGPAQARCLPCLPPKREMGAIVELRNLLEEIPLDRWEEFAGSLAAAFEALNES